MITWKKISRGHSVVSMTVLSLAVVASLCVLVTRVSYAGDIVGVINDPALQRFVDGATVTTDQGKRRAVTDRWGRYSFRGLPAGEYTVEANASGFETQSVGVTVPETGEVAVDITLTSVYLDEIVVKGRRVSQLLALQRKRAGVSILDAVSADTVGKLPDFNAAEAIQRLPGLSVELDQGEGRYPIIRGIDSNLNNVTIDGNLVGAPEGSGRRVALDVVPSDLISVVEVVKAITPDLDGNAVGGNINIVTRSALVASARVGYNEKSGRTPWSASAAWGSTLGPNDEWGLVLAGSYYIKRYDSDLAEGINWVEFAPGDFAPERQRIFDYDIERERIGLNANLEYRPNDTSLWYLRSIFNEFTDEEERDQLDFDAARGTQTVVSPTVVQNSGGRASREYRQNNQTQQLTNISIGGEFGFDNVTWGASYTFSHAEEITPLRIDWEYRSGGSAFPNTIDVSNFFWEFDAGAAINDPAEYDFRRVRRRTDAIEEDIHSIKTDLRIDRDFGSRSGYLQFGLKYVKRDKFRDRENMNYEDAVAFTLADTGLFSSGPTGFFDGRYELGPVLDFAGHESLFQSDPQMFAFDLEDSAEDSVGSDYDFEEDLYAAYGMISVDFGSTTVLGGVRLEQTDATYNAIFLELPIPDPLNPGLPTSGKNDYLDVLPSLHLTFRPRDNIIVRAAWTNTIGRPNFEDVVPSFELEDLDGSAGNVDLEPFESMGFDVSFEYYLEPSGIVSIGAFYKDIDNPIYTRGTTNVTFRGVDLDSLSQPENAESGTLLGVELNWEQQFVNLPAPWDGLGAAVNFTYVDSEVDVFGRESDDLSFFRQPDTIGNAALFYTIGRFETRLAVTYRDGYLEGIGGDVTEDVYFAEHTQVDLKMTYDATDKLSIFGEVQNINDESRGEYQGVSSRLFADEIYSWTALLGVTYAF
jgi:TonB-dependent receptor